MSLLSRLCTLAALLCITSPAMAAMDEDNLDIVFFSPQGEVAMPTQVTVQFSDAMRPLGAMEQDAATSPLQLTAPGGDLPPGNYRWLDPSTLAYLFDQPLNGTWKIEAMVGAGATSLEGRKLMTDVKWRIETPPLKVDVYSHSEIPPRNATFTLYSNYPLTPEELRAGLSFTLDGKRLDADMEADSRRSRERLVYIITLKDELPPNSSLEVNLDAGMRAGNGNAPSEKQTWSFRTYRSLEVRSWAVAPQTGKNKSEKAEPESPLTFQFNNPVRSQDLMRHLVIEPPVDLFDDKDDPATAEDRHMLWFNLPYAWQPRTTYKVTVTKGLDDDYGTTMAADYNFSFSTGDYRSVFYMDQDWHILERNLGGKFPVALRNIDTLRAQLAFRPWDAQLVIEKMTSLDKQGYNDGQPLPLYDAADSKVTARDLSLDFHDRRNSNIRLMLNLPDTFGFQGPEDMAGLTDARFSYRAKGYDGKLQAYTSRVFLQMTDLAVTGKIGRTDGLAWVTSIHSGKPVSDAEVSLLDLRGEILWSGVTDSDGLATLPGKTDLDTSPGVITVRKNGDVSVSPLSRTGFGDDYQDFLSPDGKPESEQWRVHAVTQLPLYQPGQTVNFTLYAKRFTDRDGEAMLTSPAWRPVVDTTLKLSIVDGRGKSVHDLEARTNDFGSLEGSFTLPGTADSGTYRIMAEAQGLASQVESLSFRVASFRPPDFMVSVKGPESAPNPVQVPSPPWSVAMNAAYFSSAPMPGAEATLTATSGETSFRPSRLDGYLTGWNDGPMLPWARGYPGSSPDSEPFHESTVRLDERGEADFTLPGQSAKPGKPLHIGLMGTVRDESGLINYGNDEFLVHPAAWYVGLKAPWFIPVNMEANLAFKVATWDDRAVDRATLTVTALRILPDNTPGSRNNPEFEEKTELAWNKNLEIKEHTGGSLNVTFDKSGTYRLLVSVTDPEGRQNLSSTTVIVPGAPSEWIRLRDDSRLELFTDEEEYNSGGTARILFNNPFAAQGETLALVTTERNGIFSRRLETVSGESPVIDIPLSAKDAPYIYATVTLISGRTAPPPEPDGQSGSQDDGRPASAFGSVLIKVQEEKPVLGVTVNTDADSYRPGGKVVANVTAILGDKPAPKVQVTLIAVDQRILIAAGDDAVYRPGDSFEPLYSHGVRISDSRRILVNLNMPQWRDTNSGMMLRQMSLDAAPAPDQAMMAEAAMTGGGSEESPLRQNFSPMAFWLGQGQTGRDGTLTAEFVLPDTLTSYKVIAIIADEKDSFAQGETTFTVNQPLQILSALPRFATQGDQLDGRILVQNTAQAEGVVTIRAEAQGAALGKALQTVTLGAGESAALSFPIEFADVGLGRFRFSAEMNVAGKTEQDRVEFLMAVKPAAPMTTVAAAGVLRQGEHYDLPVLLPVPLDPRSKLDLVLAPSPVAGSLTGMNAVLDYPWLCFEQQLSKAWVRAIRLRHGDMLGLTPDPEDGAVIRAILDDAAKYQGYDGGFSLWPGMSYSGYYLTAYTLLVNNESAPTGASLPPRVADRAYRYLANALNQNLDSEASPHSLVPDALAAYLLAGDDPQLASRALTAIIALAESKPERYATPMLWGSLLLTAGKLDQLPDRKTIVTKILTNLEKDAVVTPVQLHFATRRPTVDWFSMGSNLRDNAMALAALTVTNPSYPRLEGLANWVGQGVGKRKALSTQEGAYSLWALSAYLETLGGDGPMRVEADWQGRTFVAESFRRLAEQPRTFTLDSGRLATGNAGESATLGLRALEGNPYWTARLTYASPSLPAHPENAGFSLSYEWGTPGPWQVGDIVEVKIYVVVPATRRHVLLFDPFPAGLEPLYASRVDLREQNRTYQSPWAFEDIREDGILLYSSDVPPGSYSYTYKLRAAAPGSFVKRPAQVEEMYTPEVFGRTGGEKVTVAP